MQKANIKDLLIVTAASDLKLSIDDVKKGIENRCAQSIIVLDYLVKEEKKYKKIIKDYLRILESSRNGSAVTYVYSKDKKYLETIQETITELKANYKNKNNR